MEPRVTAREHVAAPIEHMSILMDNGSNPFEAQKALSFSKTLPFHLPSYHILMRLALSPLFSHMKSCTLPHCNQLTHCTMAQAPKKFGIKNFAKMRTLAPIFSSQTYFRRKYLDDISISVPLSIQIWVRVEISLLQQLNCQGIRCNSNRLQKGCESNSRDQLNRALK